MDKDIFLFGIQGAGKGTQAKLLLDELTNHKYLEMGKIFRSLTGAENIIGDYVKDIIDQGYYVKDTVTGALFTAAMETLSDTPVVIDGFPRKPHQLHIGLDRMYRHDRDFIVIFYELSKEVAVERLLKRAQEQGRVDDTPEAIERRIQQYYDETMPVIDHFKSIGKLLTVNANNTVENIFAETKKQIGI